MGQKLLQYIHAMKGVLQVTAALPETSLLSRASLHFGMTSASGAQNRRLSEDRLWWEARYSLGTAQVTMEQFTC